MSISISISIDTAADAAYIQLSHEPVARTVEFSDEVMIDLDEHDVVVGVELLDQATPVPFTELHTQFHVHSKVIETLRIIRPDVATWAAMQSGNDGSTTANRGALQPLAG